MMPHPAVTVAGLLKHGEPTPEERTLAEEIRQVIPAECLEV